MRGLPLFIIIQVVVGQGDQFLLLQRKLEGRLHEFRDFVEDIYQNRCAEIELDQCTRGSYQGCLSSFPNPTCLASNSDFANTVLCSSSSSSSTQSISTGEDNADDDAMCSSIVDFSSSSVRFPPGSSLNGDNKDLDKDLKDPTCVSQKFDAFFREIYQQDAAYWAGWDVENPWMHYSSTTGMFRIYPGRPDEFCANYDPRIRPFYVAGTSGPKNVILLLDRSGSMTGPKLVNLQIAAERIVDTLTTSDRIALIPFSTDAEAIEIGGLSLVQVNRDVKRQLKERIRNLMAFGETNANGAFEKAFQVIQEAGEDRVDCNTAVLFLTDGVMTIPEDITEPNDEEEYIRGVKDFILTGLQEMEQTIQHPVRLFTYSISQEADVHEFPKELACGTTTGVWARISEPADIVDSLSSYYTLFALGLGEGSNRDFVAWVEPYEFFSNTIYGTTLSAPVFDRSVSPPVLVGVVAIDLSMKALDRALRVPLNSTITWERVVALGVAKCPTINTTTCQDESFRRLSGIDAVCGFNCTESELVAFEGRPCNFDSDLRETLLIENYDMEFTSFEDRVCCCCLLADQANNNEPMSNTLCPEDFFMEVDTLAPTSPSGAAAPPPTTSPLEPSSALGISQFWGKMTSSLVVGLLVLCVLDWV